MALEYWELEQRRRGNHGAANTARSLRIKHGDIPLDRSQEQPPVNNMQTEQIGNRSDLRRCLLGLGIPLRAVMPVVRAWNSELTLHSPDAIQATPDNKLLSLRLLGPRALQAIRSVLPYKESQTIDYRID